MCRPETLMQQSCSAFTALWWWSGGRASSSSCGSGVQLVQCSPHTDCSGAPQNQHRPPQIVFLFNVNALPPSACHSRRPSPPCSPCVHENESDIVEARDTLQTAGESHKFIKVWCLLVSNEGKFSSQHQTRCRIYRNSSIVTTIARDGVRFLIDLLQIRRLMLHYTKSFN